MMRKSRRRASRTRSSASVRPPALSSLTFTPSYLPASAIEVGGHVHALVGADRHERARRRGARRRRRPAAAARSAPRPPRRRRACSRRKFASLHASFASTTSRAVAPLRCTARMRSASPSPPSFTLRSGIVGGGARGLRHALRRAEAQRVAGDDRLRLGEAGELPGRLARLLRLKIPQRAVERVPRRAGLHRLPQRLAVRRNAPPRRSRRARSRPSRRSADRARIRRGPVWTPSLTSATTTFTSVRAPREMTKEPAIGQVSARAVTESVMAGRRAPAAGRRAGATPVRIGSTAGRPCSAAVVLRRPLRRVLARAPRC